MAQKRAVVAKVFGERLAELRGSVSHQAVANRLGALGVKVDPSTLWQYEHGTVAAPDPRVLWGYSRLFGASVSELTTLLVEGHAERQGRTFVLSDDEAEYIERWRALSAEDRAWLPGMLDRMLGAPARRGKFREWNGVERRKVASSGTG